MEPSNSPSDSDRISRAKRGDHSGFEELIIKHQEDVRFFVAARTSDWDLVEEVVQITFVRAYHGLETFIDRGSFNAWLKGIALNVVREQLRARSRQRSCALDRIDALIADYQLEHETDVRGSSLDGQLVHLRGCLDQLPPRARELIRRRYEERVPLKRLAQQFSQTATSLAAKLKRIRAALKQCIERRAEA